MNLEQKRKWLFFPALAVGAIILTLLIGNRAQPVKTPLEEESRAVRVISVPSVSVTPRYLGTGTVAPDQVWNGVVQVSGRVMTVHPKLKKGAVIQSGEVLVEIETSDYELAIARAEASIEATLAQLAETSVKVQNGRASLKIEEDALRIARAELERKRKLLAKGTLSRTDFGTEERNALAQEQSVLAQQNSLNLYPVERQRLQAELASLETQLASARLDLERTSLHMPFTGRIAETNIERLQFVREGEVLLVADGMAKAEIPVQVPIVNMAGLLRSDKVISLVDTDSGSSDPLQGLGARVLLNNAALTVEWAGRVARISDSLDPNTRTIGVIVEVDRPYDRVQPGVRPPLVKGFFVNVELRGRPRPNSLVIPRNALHGDKVYRVSGDSRLQLREVEVSLSGAEYAVISKGLDAGDRVVVSDLQPAIDGMLLEAVDDPVALERLLAETGGGDQQP